MEEAKNSTGRQPKFELLRIVSMLLIVATHFWGKCVDLAAIEPFADGYVFGWFVKGITYVNINLYVLLSAYFMCKSTFRAKKLLLLWLEVEFYSVLLYAVSVLAGWETLSALSLIKAILPIFNSEYWFVTVYFGMYLLSPFYNKVIETFTRIQLLLLCCTLSVLFCVIPNIFIKSTWLNFGGGYGIAWFMTLYFIGGYLRLYGFPVKRASTIRIATVVLLLLPGISRIALVLLEKWLLGKVVGAGLLYFNNSVVILPASIFAFMSFATLNIKSGTKTSALINKFAAGSLAVYLIHDNPYISPKLWAWLHLYVDLSSLYYPLIFVCMVLFIWLACTLVDMLRQLLFIPFSKKKFGRRIDSFVIRIF